MQVHGEKIDEAEVWLDCFTAILSNENTASIKTAAVLTDQASELFWERFKDTTK